jgi:16S rRNA (guanine966-N2)-methyltransferase
MLVPCLCWMRNASGCNPCERNVCEEEGPDKSAPALIRSSYHWGVARARFSAPLTAGAGAAARAGGPRRVRVTGGRLARRRLLPPPPGVRPSADRVRESLFSVLGELAALRVLDLYAGTGALGIEALSRGAKSAVFVERSVGSLSILNKNLEALGLRSEARVLREDVLRALLRLGRESARFELVLMDPPYGPDANQAALEALVPAGLLVATGRVVIERSRRHPLRPVDGLESVDVRRYGDTVVECLAATRVAAAPSVGNSGGDRIS